MKRWSIRLPVGERETDKRENGSIYRWANGHFPTTIEIWLGLWQKSLQWHACNNHVKWCIHNFYKSDLKCTYRIFHQCTMLGNFFSSENTKRDVHMCIFRQGWKNIGAPGTLDIGIQTIKNSWGRLFLEVIVSRVRRLKKVGGSALFVSWSGVGCP